MKIKKYRKIKNNKYLVILENNQEIELYEELILKYKFLLTKEVPDDLEPIIRDNILYECYHQALKYLKFKKRTAYEIKLKLQKLGYQEREIQYTLNELEKQKYIDDYQYASSFLTEKLSTTTHGPNRIRNDLTSKGIQKNIIENIIEQYTDNIQREKIDKLISKIIKNNQNKGNDYIKRKIYNDLCYQGFSSSIIEERIEIQKFSSDLDLRKKEEEKLRRKYEQKYKGKELEYKVKQALYRKGLLNEYE